jgi:hypothetical protein
MAKRKHRKITPEDEARHRRVLQMARERIAWREAKERELEAAREREQKP